MDHVHGIDVSWMTHGAPKDKTNRSALRRPSVSSQHNDTPATSRTPPSTNGNDSAQLQVPSSNGPKTPSPPRPGFMRGNSAEKQSGQSGQNGQNGSTPQRRASWLQNISSKFSSSSASPPVQSPPQPDLNAAPADPPVPKIAPAKNAVLQHATKYEGDGPYTPAPPKTQGSFLQVFRRFSGTNGGNQTQTVKGNHGLVDRITLNVDQHRERCPIHELNQAKLRRVAFCVDVEIAPMPKYSDSTVNVKKVGKTQRKLSEKGEAEALKNPEAVKEQKEKDGVIHITGEPVPKEPDIEGSESPTSQKEGPTALVPQKEVSAKKKEKKKRSEEERKARKEKKRQQAEASGSIPMEIHRNSTDSDSSSSPATSGPRKTHAFPTTNPVRIYRRCCQLRESPILKKITEQLTNPSNSVVAGLVEKLDLTGYYMDLSDLVTLGDYFAVVPVREVILEGCGLTDEGLRVVLAGLLAAKRQGRRRKPSSIDGLANQGGVVERLVLKNNKIGPEGWKHISLFLYMCRSLKYLDVSAIKFPIQQPSSSLSGSETTAKAPIDTATLFSKAIGERLAGPELELLNLGGTELKCEQLGMITDGIIKCGIRRLGLANNDIDADGLEHVARYLRHGKCEGLDLGGNDLRERLEVIGNTLTDDHPLWALSLADCDLNPLSLCKLLPKLAKLPNFRFIDLSHNHDLFNSDPNAVGILRRYLPKMACLKRIHLADVALSSEQTIALVEILPEVPGLAHINLLENPHLVSLADARTEESQEEACALYASLLAATRVSSTIVCVDIDIPSESSSEVVKALAKQVVAYCLRNMEKIQVPELGTTTSSITEPEEQSQSSSLPQAYPDVLLNLVGNEPGEPELEDKIEVAPDEDYVIGGTGVVKALACCLKNRGDESRRQSGEFIREVETGHIASRPKLPPGKAKDMSKHLLISARKIRMRLQPSLEKWKFNKEDKHTYQRLLFLAETLDGIIKRFEDEFPDTREPPSPPLSSSPLALTKQDSVTETIASTGADEAFTTLLSDADDDGLSTNIKPRSRSNSILSHTAKSLAEEEGRMLRAGHKFRRGFLKQEHWEVLSSLEELGSDPRHLNMLDEMVAELGDEYLKRRVAELGVLETFRVEKERVFRLLREADPDHWARFIESQEKARVNVQPGQTPAVKVGGVVVEENAVED